METAQRIYNPVNEPLWFAFILVTLSHWKQRHRFGESPRSVVICFHFSNFEPLETAFKCSHASSSLLWFAFILVTLSHWKQPQLCRLFVLIVVICFHFSNFEPLETANAPTFVVISALWFAFILVTLSHWKQPRVSRYREVPSCDLLSF